MTVGERLKDWRGALSQKAAASACGIKQQAWNRWEKNETEPGADSIRKICAYFGRHADELLGLEEAKPSVKVEQRGNGNISQIGSGNIAANCSNCASKQLADLMKQLGITIADFASIAAKKSAAKLQASRSDRQASRSDR